MMVFHWHGNRAGLDYRGGARPPATGIGDLKAMGVTHVGVPMHHEGGSHDGYNYITGLVNAGFKIVRCVELPWNAGVREGHYNGAIDLGRILNEWDTAAHPGEFFQDFARNLELPMDGIAWNLEHDILNIDRYPVTGDDLAFYEEAYGRRLASGLTPTNADLSQMRCLQFALLMRMYADMAEKKAGKVLTSIAYSGYPGAEYRGLPLDQAYGVDWRLHTGTLHWNGSHFPGIRYAMCSFPSEKLIAECKPPYPQILHTMNSIQETSPSTIDERRIRKLMVNRLERMRPEDGMGFVASHYFTWTASDGRLAILLSEAKAEHALNQSTWWRRALHWIRRWL